MTSWEIQDRHLWIGFGMLNFGKSVLDHCRS
jgi:hypothetical protein